MIRIVLLSTIAATLLFGEMIDTLIDYALRNHPSLAAVAHRIEAADARVAESGLWKNPDIAFTINDIALSHPTRRSLEPMQFEAVTFKQSLPLFGKTHLRQDVARMQKRLRQADLYDAEVTLALRIRLAAYRLKELTLRMAILDRYLALTRQSIALYNDAIATDGTSHAKGMRAQLALYTLKIRKKHLEALAEATRERLFYLVGKPIKRIDDTLEITKPKSLAYYMKRLENAPQLIRTKRRADIAASKSRLRRAEEIPDPYLKAGYYHRNAFEDYATISVGISAPIYGRERYETEASRKELLAARSAYIDKRARLRSQILQTYTLHKEAYETYRILQNESLPQLRHIQDLRRIAVEKGSDLPELITILEERLMLEEKCIAARSMFLQTAAQLDAAIGVSR